MQHMGRSRSRYESCLNTPAGNYVHELSPLINRRAEDDDRSFQEVKRNERKKKRQRVRILSMRISVCSWYE